MARRYSIEIRGKAYSIEVEEKDVDQFQVVVEGETYDVTLSGDEDLPEAAITPAFAPHKHGAPAGAHSGGPAPVVKATPALAMPKPAPRRLGAGSATLNAPMPGVILDIMVKAGDKVTRGQEVAVLEAMKMQNMIRSPRDGTIAEVCVEAGQAVGHGDAIVRFEA